MASWVFILFPSILIILNCCISSASFEPKSFLNEEAKLHDRFEKWIIKFNRSYANEKEKSERYKIFKKNVQYIDSSNKDRNRTFVLGLNIFSDMSKDEFRASHGGGVGLPSNRSTVRGDGVPYARLVSNLPPSVDWRKKGAVTNVKNQGLCESCWAFASVATVEGINKIKTGSLISLSEQELLDCEVDNGGCTGGYLYKAFDFILQNGVTATENYPYQESQGSCNSRASSSNPKVHLSSYIELPTNNELALQHAVARQPIAVAISTNCDAFQHYAGGIFSIDCGATTDHFLALIGYGTDKDTGNKYWIAKNSWGEGWGENGFMKILRDAGYPQGLCGLATEAYYPVLSK